MYATVSDVEARWRTLDADEQVRATVLLEDAAVRIDTACPASVPPTSQELGARLIVSCEMVKRAMSNPGGVGITSLQEGSGPFQQTAQFANPTGDLYLTKADRLLLGCGAQTAFTVPMGCPSVPVAPDWWVS